MKKYLKKDHIEIGKIEEVELFKFGEGKRRKGENLSTGKKDRKGEILFYGKDIAVPAYMISFGYSGGIAYSPPPLHPG